MKASVTALTIYVSDFNRALRYYTNVLGFMEDFRHADYAGLSIDNVSIHLSGPTNPGTKEPGNAHFYIACDYTDIYFDAIKRYGAIIVVPLAERFNGVRDFTINDHDGNTLVFAAL